MSIWPVEEHRTVPAVAVSDGPPLTLTLTYTIQHGVPHGMLQLPRSTKDPVELARDRCILTNLYISSIGEIWERKYGVWLDERVRNFLGNRPSAQVYDPWGVQITPEQLYGELNQYLAATLECERGIRVEVRGIEVVGMDTQAAMAWRHRMLLEILSLMRTLPSEQAYAAAEIFRGIAGSGWTTRVGLDPSDIFRAQQAGNPPAPSTTPPNVTPWPRRQKPA
jgi:hypothetical protein